MPKKKLKQRIILVLLGIFSALVLLEIGMRTGGIIYLSVQEKMSASSVKQKGAYRILCLGESTTLVGGKASYPYLLEEILNQSKIGVKFKVINKGTPGIDTSYIVSQLEHNLKKYKPDMVITMMGINDVQDLIALENSFFSSAVIFFKSFRIYKLARAVGLSISARKNGARLYSDNQFPGMEEKNEGKYKKILRNASSKPAIKISLKDGVDYFELGKLYRDKAKFKEAEEYFKKAIELNQMDDGAYFEVGRFYRDRGYLPESKEAFNKAIELNPQNDFAYLGLGWLCLESLDYPGAEGYFKKATEINPENTEAQIELGWAYRMQGKLIPAEQAFKKAIELNSIDDRLYSGLAICYNEQKKYALAEKYFRAAAALRAKYFCPFTYRNYQEVKNVLDKNGIRLVCVQYPMRDVESLKRMFAGQQGVLFVDNEKIFKDALKQASYKEYFVDAIAGDFGHCTYKGNRLLAANIADTILKKVFGE